jgi:superkiller protein 3
LEKYNQLENNDFESFFLKGCLMKQLAKYEEALECFARTVQLKPNFFEG